MNPFEDIPLRDIHGAPPVPWWPPAPGWWVVMVLLTAVVCYLAYLGLRHLRRHRQKQRILEELDTLNTRFASDEDRVSLARDLSIFVRRLALAQAGQRVSGLHGGPWLRYLDESGETSGFTAGVGQALAEAPYRAAADFDALALIELVRGWASRVLAQGAGRGA